MTAGEIAILIGAAIVLLCQSNWLFADARKHSRYPWFWGLWGLVQCPMPLLFYWLIVRRPANAKKGLGDESKHK
ncbi:hypothetical protein [Paenibacillus sacheonensis]|uniref:SigmaY antisigma factor component n=1 Tax=Paenibacillus sacheonensis TaxID=742054 RepID=A0A7X4YP33_9BACL|nr:hypothetical protein [Paenibacillus sacheonensis]MBM7565303.1 hypothetical protein [Paenibacillus sacheonensis]NBC69926.1 hypothetical protein [Paenibacillus sacheonensis]